MAYLASRVIEPCVTKLEQINNAIDEINAEIKNPRTELAAADERIATFEEQGRKANAELQQAQEEVKKMLENNKDRTEDLTPILGDSIWAAGLASRVAPGCAGRLQFEANHTKHFHSACRCDR